MKKALLVSAVLASTLSIGCGSKKGHDDSKAKGDFKSVEEFNAHYEKLKQDRIDAAIEVDVLGDKLDFLVGTWEGEQNVGLGFKQRCSATFTDEGMGKMDAEVDLKEIGSDAMFVKKYKKIGVTFNLFLRPAEQFPNFSYELAKNIFKSTELFEKLPEHVLLSKLEWDNAKVYFKDGMPDRIERAKDNKEASNGEYKQIVCENLKKVVD